MQSLHIGREQAAKQHRGSCIHETCLYLGAANVLWCHTCHTPTHGGTHTHNLAITLAYAVGGQEARNIVNCSSQMSSAILSPTPSRAATPTTYGCAWLRCMYLGCASKYSDQPTAVLFRDYLILLYAGRFTWAQRILLQWHGIQNLSLPLSTCTASRTEGSSSNRCVKLTLYDVTINM